MNGTRLFFGGLFIGLFVAIAAGQTAGLCIVEQPLPELPDDYGTLDAQTSVIFQVEFLPDATLGKIGLVKSSGIRRLDRLACDAVAKITFKPQMVNGSPAPVRKVLQYRYSYLNPGWRVIRRKETSFCPKPQAVRPVGSRRNEAVLRRRTLT